MSPGSTDVPMATGSSMSISWLRIQSPCSQTHQRSRSPFPSHHHPTLPDIYHSTSCTAGRHSTNHCTPGCTDGWGSFRHTFLPCNCTSRLHWQSRTDCTVSSRFASSCFHQDLLEPHQRNKSKTLHVATICAKVQRHGSRIPNEGSDMTEPPTRRTSQKGEHAGW
jgi:hypothetical protein